MIRIKICGITNEEDIRICACEGVDALGFVVEYPIPVPWNLKRHDALRLMQKVPPFVSKVAVLGDDPDQVMEITEYLRPDVVQLHGNEPLDITKRLILEIKSLNIKVIKAVRFSIETGKPISEIKDPVILCNTLKEMGADAVVLDSVSGSMPAGTGKRIDWNMASYIRSSTKIPVILAGGLNPENVHKAISEVKPFAVDVISGVEAKTKKGKKHPLKVKSFVREVKRYGQKF